jgi:hypothetical protein
VTASVEPAETAGTRTCVNCGGAVPDRYCGACGQKVYEGRFVLRELASGAAEEIARVDKGILFTALELTRRPGEAIREFVEGRTRPYTHPFKYLLVAVGLATFLLIQLGGFGGMMPATVEGSEVPERAAMLLEVLTRYFNVMLIAAVPFHALFSRRMFRGAGLNGAEHLVFNTYVYAHQNLLGVLCLPAFFLTGRQTTVFVTLYTVVVLIYYILACRGFFRTTLPQAIWRGTVTTVLAYVTYYVALTVVILAITLTALSLGLLPGG